MSDEEKNEKRPEGQSEGAEQKKPSSGKAPEPKKKRSKKPLIILLLVVLIGGTAGYFYYLHARNYEKTDDAFVDGHVVQVSPKVAALVTAVHFDDNQQITKGDLLVELDPRDFQVSLEKAQTQLAQAKGQLEQRKAELAQSEAQLAQAQAQLLQQRSQFEIANINFNRNAGLFQKDLRAVAKQDVDTTKATSEGARAALAASEANVKSVEAAGEAAKAQVTAAEANVANSEAAVHDAELQISYTKIYAVDNGRIARKQVEPGDYVQPAQVLTSLVLDDLWVTANYKETQLTKMLSGQTVDIKVDAFPKRALKGRVESFQPGTGARFSLLPPENATGNYVKVVQRVPVKIVFDEEPEVVRQLGVGMSVVPTVDLRTAGKPQNREASR